MPNTFFQFKQFTIHQDKCAMKVCTDACLFGAWAAEKMQWTIGKWQKAITNDSELATNVLDIGTGTGLLSLMLAQKTDFEIDAVEMDEDAAAQARENVAASPWKNQIIVHTSTIQLFKQTTRYDFIISNPPFYESDLKSPNLQKNLAYHSNELTLLELMENIKRLLKPNGEFALLLPAHRTNEFIKLANDKDFYLQEWVQVKQTEKHVPFRSMLWFGSNEVDVSLSEITIKVDNNYTEDFINFLKPYYLHL